MFVRKLHARYNIVDIGGANHNFRGHAIETRISPPGKATEFVGIYALAVDRFSEVFYKKLIFIRIGH